MGCSLCSIFMRSGHLEILIFEMSSLVSLFTVRVVEVILEGVKDSDGVLKAVVQI